MLLKSIRSDREKIHVWEQLATDHFDPWQVVPRQVHVFTPYFRLLFSNAFVVDCCVSCLRVAGVVQGTMKALVPVLVSVLTD